jgi:hypothetical protein
MIVKTLTGASAVFSAAHESREGVLHGHTWQVTAWWWGEPDAVQKQKDLRAYLSRFDHTVLPASSAWGEQLGAQVLRDLGCAKVDVSRPLEGIFAVVERQT